MEGERTCPTCNETGEVDCPACDGKGEGCEDCEGSGKSECPDCEWCGFLYKGQATAREEAAFEDHCEQQAELRREREGKEKHGKD